MDVVLKLLFFSFLGINLFPDIYSSIAFSITLTIFAQIVLKSNNSFMFREWALFLYSLNFLLSPAITYQLKTKTLLYGMKINSETYFSLAIPGFLMFALGMFIIPNRLFRPNLQKVNQATIINEKFLLILTIIGVLLGFIYDLFPGELTFIFYLLSMLRFIGSFSLFASNPKKHIYLVIVILLIDLFLGFRAGMYHDAIMWVVFFALFFVYIQKPRFILKLFGGMGLIILVLFIQAVKKTYREEVWSGEKENSIETISSIGSLKANKESLIGEDNLTSTLSRGNQAWIFASTIDRMERIKDFQGMNNVYKYLEAALLPRFIAPDKIKSGDQEIFNKYSGHSINNSTAMGLGIFADGYIAYGEVGVYVFGFILGFIFSLTFKIIERWTLISPFYMLLILPLLNYAVRPDCETQTIFNHLFKGLLLFGFLVYLTRKKFSLESLENQRRLNHLNLLSKKI
jgi:hypothetical protein